jgi:cell division protein FtsL
MNTKKLNILNEQVLVKMDRRLRLQLEQTAKSHNTKISSIARLALQKFCDENTDKTV